MNKYSLSIYFFVLCHTICTATVDVCTDVSGAYAKVSAFGLLICTATFFQIFYVRPYNWPTEPYLILNRQ